MHIASGRGRDVWRFSMSAQKRLEGQRFGKLLVISMAEERHKGRLKWNVVCDCGVIKIVAGTDLRSGHARSCGCEGSRATIGARTFRHGEKRTRFYTIWSEMWNRTMNKKHSGFKDYGARGIKVWDSWGDYMKFRADMKESYDEHVRLHGEADTSIERINNDGNYEPGNVRWATKYEQGRNKRNNVWLTYKGETMILTDWAKKLGFSRGKLTNRLRRGWSVEEALSVV